MYNFPSSPAENQEYTPAGGVTYIYNAPRWNVKPVAYAPLASPAFTGNPTSPTPAPGDNDTSIATTGFVFAAMTAAGSVSPSDALPLINGTAAAGVSALYTRGDHVHPIDSSRVAKAGDTMTGALAISNTTASTSSSIGALTVVGGVGIGGDLLWAGANSTIPGVGNVFSGGCLGAGGYIAVSRSSGVAMHLNTNSSGIIQLMQQVGNGVGNISVTTTSTAYNTSSDGRLKEDLKSFDAGRIIDDTLVFDFAWKSTGVRSYGVIAQQANEVYPAAVFYDKETDWFGIDYSKYVPVLLQEVKSLRLRIAALEAKLIAEPTA